MFRGTISEKHTGGACAVLNVVLVAKITGHTGVAHLKIGNTYPPEESLRWLAEHRNLSYNCCVFNKAESCI